ncbi:MAG: carbohydrate ABC transporter permease [Clostridium sp.]|nr:carbohydrate ABC transporter permease [Clostridium sp.]
MKKKKSIQIFDVVNSGVMVLMMAVMLFPFWYCVAGSLNDGTDYLKGGVYLWPRIFTGANYQAVFKDATIFRSFMVSVAKTLLGSLSSLFVTALAAYAMCRPQLKGRKFYAAFMTLTMYFSGGLIPYFLVIKGLYLYDNFLVYIIPGLFSVWNMIIIRSFFSDLPDSLIESAKMDGAGEYRIFFQIVLPLSKPVLATVLLFSLVGHWNSYFDSMMYTSSMELQTIQLFLKKMITDPGTASGLAASAAMAIPESAKKVTPQTIKLAAMIVTSAPIICVYPFLQKYFVKGMTMGAVKG